MIEKEHGMQASISMCDQCSLYAIGLGELVNEQSHSHISVCSRAPLGGN